MKHLPIYQTLDHVVYHLTLAAMVLKRVDNNHVINVDTKKQLLSQLSTF